MEHKYIRKAADDDWRDISVISSESGYGDDYINRMGRSFLADGDVYVHSVEGTISGFIKIQNFYGKFQWLSGLRVRPDFRRQGIATDLTLFAVDKGRSEKLPFSRLLIEEHNYMSINLALKCGFMQKDCFFFMSRSPDISHATTTSYAGKDIMVDTGWVFGRIHEIHAEEYEFLTFDEWEFFKFGEHIQIIKTGESDLDFSSDRVSSIHSSSMKGSLMKYLHPSFPTGCVFERTL